MLDVFKEVKEKEVELETLRVVVQATEITYRQKGEFYTADRFKELENTLSKVICLLEDSCLN